jgi:hypothetical protein
LSSTIRAPCFRRSRRTVRHFASLSRARSSINTLTPGSPRIPRPPPSVQASISRRTLSTPNPRALATRGAWSSAFFRLMRGRGRSPTQLRHRRARARPDRDCSRPGIRERADPPPPPVFRKGVQRCRHRKRPHRNHIPPDTGRLSGDLYVFHCGFVLREQCLEMGRLPPCPGRVTLFCSSSRAA